MDRLATTVAEVHGPQMVTYIICLIWYQRTIMKSGSCPLCTPLCRRPHPRVEEGVMRRIGVGIPTLNEAATIGRTVELVDRGLQQLPGGGIIINSDSGSTDGTVDIFRRTATVARKLSAVPRWERPGKGANVLAIVEQARDLDLHALVLVDADVTSLRSDWVPLLASPLLAGRAHYASASYVASQGGPLRHLVSRPFVYGLFGADIPQPTGGEVGMSRALIDHICASARQGSDFGYGIDIALAGEVAIAPFSFTVVDLGTKVHRSRPWSTIDSIAVDVVESGFRLFTRVCATARPAEARRSVQFVPETAAVDLPSPRIMDLGRAAARWRSEREKYNEIYARLLPIEAISAATGPDPSAITSRIWMSCFRTFAVAARNGEDPALLADAVMPLFLGRMAAFGGELVTEGPARVAACLQDELERCLTTPL